MSVVTHRFTCLTLRLDGTVATVQITWVSPDGSLTHVEDMPPGCTVEEAEACVRLARDIVERGEPFPR